MNLNSAVGFEEPRMDTDNPHAAGVATTDGGGWLAERRGQKEEPIPEPPDLSNERSQSNAFQGIYSLVPIRLTASRKDLQAPQKRFLSARFFLPALHHASQLNWPAELFAGSAGTLRHCIADENHLRLLHPWVKGDRLLSLLLSVSIRVHPWLNCGFQDEFPPVAFTRQGNLPAEEESVPVSAGWRSVPDSRFAFPLRRERMRPCPPPLT